jgi:hypothetical protein
MKVKVSMENGMVQVSYTLRQENSTLEKSKKARNAGRENFKTKVEMLNMKVILRTICLTESAHFITLLII